MLFLAHHFLGSTSANFFLSLSLSLYICKYSYPLCFLTPIPEDTDFRGSSKSYLQPFLWAGHEHQAPGILGLDQHVAVVRAQPASLGQVCWQFLINKLSKWKRSHQTQYPSWGRNSISGSWPRIKTRYFLPQEFTLDQVQKEELSCRDSVWIWRQGLRTRHSNENNPSMHRDFHWGISKSFTNNSRSSQKRGRQIGRDRKEASLFEDGGTKPRNDLSESVKCQWPRKGMLFQAPDWMHNYLMPTNYLFEIMLTNSIYQAPFIG